MQKNFRIIMLNQSSGEQPYENPLLNVFEEGIEEFVRYQKQKPENYKSKAQKHKEKIQKIERDLNDLEMKKQRNHQRRQAEKNKLNKITQGMTEEELSEFYTLRNQKKKEDREKVRKSVLTGQVMIIDLVYEDRMNSKENRSLAKQIELIMQSIKQLDQPPSVHLCSLGGQTKNQLEKMGYKHWPITAHQGDIVAVGDALGKKLVYLSPDAEQPLEKVQANCAYILGGLIDRTIIKNTSLTRAKELGIETRRLPIRQFMKSRIVLNLDHVVMMVLKFREVNDWKVAFDFAAPKRWKRDAENNEKEQSHELKSKQNEVKGESSDQVGEKIETVSKE